MQTVPSISRWNRIGSLVLMAVIALSACSCNSFAKAKPGPSDPDAPTEFTTTDTGLKYRILRKSDGPKPGPSDRVLAHYRGWLDDKTEFDSSYDRGKPSTFGLNQVITGWTEGLQLVGEGGMIELEIPSQYGYGFRGATGIPPDSTLHFLVELIEIK